MVVRVVTALGSWIPFFSLICYSGQSISNEYVALNEEVYNLSWFLCKKDIKQAVKLVIQISQKPVYMCGYADFRCSNETFKKVNTLFISFSCDKQDGELLGNDIFVDCQCCL